jgi:hypothetical protein
MLIVFVLLFSNGKGSAAFCAHLRTLRAPIMSFLLFRVIWSCMLVLWFTYVQLTLL